MPKRASTQLAVYNSAGITLSDGMETCLFVGRNGGLLTEQVTSVASDTAVVATVANSATSTTLIAANDQATERIITNTSPAALYVKFGTTASTSDFTIKLATDEALTTAYSGRIDGIWSSASTGGAQVTELS